MRDMIYKTQLNRYQFGSQIVMASKDWKALSVGDQGNDLTLWYETDVSTAQISAHTVLVYPTGQGVGIDLSQWIFVGSVQMSDGLVYHVYQENEDE